MKVSGKEIIWKVLVYTYGMMVVVMRENINTIKSMVMEFMYGLIKESTRDTGLEESNMV